MTANFRAMIWVSAVTALICARATFGHDGDHSTAAPPDAKCVTEQVLVGIGAETYQSVPNWCQLPQGREKLGDTHGGVVVDKAGLIYFSMNSGDQGMPSALRSGSR